MAPKSPETSVVGGNQEKEVEPQRREGAKFFGSCRTKKWICPPEHLGFFHRQDAKVAKVEWMSGSRHISWRSLRLRAFAVPYFPILLRAFAVPYFPILFGMNAVCSLEKALCVSYDPLFLGIIYMASRAGARRSRGHEKRLLRDERGVFERRLTGGMPVPD